MADEGPKLNARQRLFVSEYIKDLNGTQAAIRAGYSQKTARSIATENLTIPAIKDAITAATAPRLASNAVTADRILAAISAVAFGDIRGMFDENGNLQLPSEWDDETAAAVAGLEIVTVSKGEGAIEHVAKIKRADRLRALDMLARHHSLYNDTVTVKGVDELADRLARAARRTEPGGNPPLHVTGRGRGLGEKG